MSTKIHPSAIVDPKAELAEGVEVGPYAIIEANVFIGKNSKIDAHASVKSYTRMGEKNRVHSYACIGVEPQDLKFHGEESWLEIGNNNNIREFSTLSRGTELGSFSTKVGDNNLFMAYTHVAHDCQLGNNIIMSNCATLAGHVQVDDFVILSGLSAVHQFVRIGTHAFVGGKTGIAQDLPPYMLAIGNRGGVQSPNLVGLKRMGASQELVSIMKNVFRMFWKSDLSRSEALDQIEKEYGQHQEVINFVNFVRLSERGVLSTFEQSKNSD
ncbi:acyl-ACP--UDP-N-acetylglucosamine O-acyltransferase [Desulfovibrio litoralis]|uniref:Acyl-[acyl-carrier-protein]--UDP-N-acetylglucosamine O-acyltransferase n=1 Tax=Desulfovibrio litoralis DSM 11393 TaxID=1121455 RepID=A0A1M7SNC5_9BACT|nr:acyl-ACP--UDP-N-acetylglucosamine O-acyltransferase [Desulfovibrio litoralis]SHN59971.1 acyl-[acyl-carrier-protein]--UDP-N-acetylglucosamine O-acyltransferase [Desulfovibrio litoralis DSM 11393]